MDGFHPGAGVLASTADARRFRRWSKAVADEIVRRTGEGEALRAICRDPEMPALRVAIGWMTTRSGFAEAMRAARAEAGRRFVGGPSTYCRETAEAIFERLCAGEAIVDICADDDMPARTTVYKWIRDHPEFARAVALAREIQGDALAAEARRIAREVTPASARACEVRLRHLRWDAGKMAPKRYGTVGLTPAWAAAGDDGPPAPREAETVLTIKTFWLEAGPDGRTRVRSRWYDPSSGQIEADVPGDWGPAPPGPRRLGREG